MSDAIPRLQRWRWAWVVLLLGLGVGAGAYGRARYGARLMRKLGLEPIAERPASDPAAAALAKQIREAEAGADASKLRESFIERYPRSWQVHRQTVALARDTAAEGRVDDAIDRLERHAAAAPISGQRHEALAVAAGLAHDGGLHERAAALYDRALAEPATATRTAATRLRSAELLVALGLLEEALERFRRCAAGEPRGAAMILILEARLGHRPPRELSDYRALAKAHVTVGDRAAAERTWAAARGVVELTPKDKLARAANLVALEDTAGGLAIYRSLALARPRIPAGETAALRWARLLVAQRGFDQARNVYREVLRFPDGRHRFEAWLGLGEVEVKLEVYRSARAAFGNALRLATRPGQQWAARLSIGWCHIRAREIPQAIRYLSGLVEGAEGWRPRVRWALAKAYELARDTASMRSQLEEIVRESPRTPMAAKARKKLEEDQ